MLLGFISDLSASASILLIICLLGVCVFEAINGFHDTANAVATVIYTHALKPIVAVVWSGIWNFLGVLLGGIAVAMSVIKLVPLNDLMLQPLGENISLVLAILCASIIWNLGTWYFGIPCSSSHTLIGALLGSGFAFWSIHGGSGPNWHKGGEIGLSLLISPLFGFSLAIMLMYILRVNVKKRKKIFDEPDPQKAPPTWIRAILIATCTLVSFFHGSNDGQKGVGLLLVVFIAFMPVQFVLNHSTPAGKFAGTAHHLEQTLKETNAGQHTEHVLALAQQAGSAALALEQLDKADKNQLHQLRKNIQSLVINVEADLKTGVIPAKAAGAIEADLSTLKTSYEFAPLWMILLISICLGIGTMIGWKRIVVTIGEKIGKTHLSYAQGASAELCAAATIGVSTAFGLPVSTTHVLSSGIAGTMVASGGVQNLQKKTIRNIALAWILTLPVSFVVSAGLFYLLRIFF